MDTTKIKDSQIRNTLTKIVSKNLSALVQPCFKPSLQTHYFELLRLTGLTDKDIKLYAKNKWKGRKEEKFFTHKDPKSNFYIFLMTYFLQKNDLISFKLMMLFFIMRHYRARMDIHFPKFCNEDLFRYALEKINRTHLFAREKTIPNSIYFIANEMIKKYQKAIKNDDLDGISAFMQESRTRIRQSVASFAETYYKANEEGAGIKTEEDPSDDQENDFQYKSEEKSTRSIDEVTRKITVYKYIDKKAEDEARKICRVNRSAAIVISNNINDVKYADNIRIVLQFFIKDLKNRNEVCGKEFYKYVRDLMAIKRQRAKVSFKQQVNELTLKVLEDSKYIDRYNKLTPQTQFLLNLYLAYYLTMIFRSKVC